MNTFDLKACRMQGLIASPATFLIEMVSFSSAEKRARKKEKCDSHNGEIGGGLDGLADDVIFGLEDWRVLFVEPAVPHVEREVVGVL